MATFRFDLNEEYGERLKRDAIAHHMSIQDYIRFKLFNVTTIFTVEEVVKRIQNGNFENKEFTLPDAYTDEEWTIGRGPAGVLGKQFYNYVIDNPELGIHYVPNRTIKRRAVYIYKKAE